MYSLLTAVVTILHYIISLCGAVFVHLIRFSSFVPLLFVFRFRLLYRLFFSPCFISFLFFPFFRLSVSYILALSCTTKSYVCIACTNLSTCAQTSLFVYYYPLQSYIPSPLFPSLFRLSCFSFARYWRPPLCCVYKPKRTYNYANVLSTSPIPVLPVLRPVLRGHFVHRFDHWLRLLRLFDRDPSRIYVVFTPLGVPSSPTGPLIQPCNPYFIRSLVRSYLSLSPSSFLLCHILLVITLFLSSRQPFTPPTCNFLP